MTEDQLYNMSEEEQDAAMAEAFAERDTEVAEETEITEEVEAVEEIAEEEVDELEQPETDSDDDTSSDEEVEEEVTEDSDPEEGALDEEPEAEEEQPEVVEEETKTEEQPAKIHKFRANGRDYEFTDEEMQKQFPKVFGQAMDYTKKTQEMKPDRKKLDIVRQAGLSEDDLNLAVDLLKGDKGALKTILEKNAIDALDLEGDEHNYVAKDYGRDETTLAIDDVVQKISSDKEYATTHNILTKEWDQKSWDTMSADPETIGLLHTDVKSGMYDKLAPIMEKQKVFDGGSKSDLDYYLEAASIYDTQVRQEQMRTQATQEAASNTAAQEQARLAEVKQKQVKAAATKQQSGKRKAAAPTSKRVATKQTTDYLDESDESFDKWYAELQDRM